jgi:hypothetical protein
MSRKQLRTSPKKAHEAANIALMQKLIERIIRLNSSDNERPLTDRELIELPMQTAVTQ